MISTLLKPKAFVRFICMTHFNSRISYFYVGTYKTRVFIEHWNNAGMENPKVNKLTAELSHIKSNRKKRRNKKLLNKRERIFWLNSICLFAFVVIEWKTVLVVIP